jgi:hypothetical protein
MHLCVTTAFARPMIIASCKNVLPLQGLFSSAGLPRGYCNPPFCFPAQADRNFDLGGISLRRALTPQQPSFCFLRNLLQFFFTFPAASRLGEPLPSYLESISAGC